MIDGDVILNKERALSRVHARLKACRLCPNMQGSAVHGVALDTQILLLGQAPGLYEGPRGKPFAHTAGKTLFKWLEQAIGADEETVRGMIYFSAVARCFPGKAKSGAGDRVPDRKEISNCRANLSEEVRIIRPEMILAVGKLAITEALGHPCTLDEVVGESYSVTFHGVRTKVIPLPHPSGVSRWPHTPGGQIRLKRALDLVAKHFHYL